MKLMQWLQCIRGNHHRSRGQARLDGAVFRSICRGCGKPMVRTPYGWILASEADRDAGSTNRPFRGTASRT